MTTKQMFQIALAVFLGTVAANLVAAKLVADQVQAQASASPLNKLLGSIGL